MKRLAIFVVLLSLFGCHGGAYSKLAGGWVPEKGKVVRIEESTISEEEYKYDLDEMPAVIIRDDGTFDWRFTALAVVGMYTDREVDLRHKGDRIDFIDKESGKDNGYVEIRNSQYSETSSYMMIYIDDKSIGKSTSVSYNVCLRWDGKIDYEEVIEEARRKKIHTAVMKRWGKPLSDLWKSIDSQGRK